jgi:tetratricopeptide (TPR) repeat protein
MEALCRSGRPASALAVYATARDRFAEDLGVSPAASTEALHTAILLGELPASSIGNVAVERTTSHLSGRDDALRALDAMFEHAAAGQRQVGFVEGEAGIGKSRLLQVWSARVADRARVIGVRCDELGRSLPLQPLLDAVEVLLRQEGPGAAADVLGADISVLGPLLVAHVEPAGSAQLAALTDPGAGQALLFAALFSVFRRQADSEPLVLIIDDVHLADTATSVWLGQASRRFVDARVAVIGARRAEEAFAVRDVKTISLGPLDLEAVAAVVGRDRAAELHARSGGHPLFLVELAAAGTGAVLPATIREAVKERCDRAGPAGATLRAAAVIGPDIDLDTLAAVTGAAPGQLLDHLEERVRRRLLVEDGATFAFAHALVREALAATIGAARAALLHREAARALRVRRGSDPLAVAHHARLGGELADASAMLIIAARRAIDRYDYEESLRLLHEAVALDDTAEARLERARVQSMLGHYEAATEDIEAARASGAGPEVLEVAAWLAHFQRHFDDALALADRGAGEATDPDVRTSCLALGGWVSLAIGDLGGSESRLESAVGGAPEGSGRLAEAWLGWLRTYQGRSEETLNLIRSEPGNGLAAYRFPNAYAQMAATMALATLGRVDEALVTLDALTGDVALMGAQRWTARPLNLRGWIVRNLGETQEADDLNQAATEATQPLGLAEPLAHALLDLASGRLLVGNVEQVGPLLDQAGRLGDLEHAFRWRHQLRGRLLRARLDEVAGLEGWWITAGVARVFAVDAWKNLAQRRVGALLQRAGSYATALERAASRIG